MAKVIEIRKAIQSALLSVHPRVYFLDADEDADYPYLVYDLPNSVDDGALENFVLELDGWDAPDDGSTIALETLMEAADSVLQRAVFRVGDMAIIAYRDNRLTIRDPDKRLRRRQYNYQLRTYGGG